MVAATMLLVVNGGAAASAMPRGAGIPALSRVVVIVMENESYGGIIGNPDAPYINDLATRSGLASDYYAIRHPSLPNYIALLGGSTFGIRTDCKDCSVGYRTNLVDQMETAGVSWKAYMSAMPSPCYSGPDTNLYAKRHNPFFYYADIVEDPARCNLVVPMTQLGGDIAGGTLPQFVWITPDLCQDMHDCSVATGDAFLSGLVPTLLDQLGPSGALFITWDEGNRKDTGSCCTRAKGGHVVTIVAGPGVIPGGVIGTPLDHYSLMQAIEDGLGLPRLRGAKCLCTPSMGGFFL